MKQRRLGKTGWQVSAVSMGCLAIGGQWGEVSERQAIATVHAALDAEQVAAIAAVCPPEEA